MPRKERASKWKNLNGPFTEGRFKPVNIPTSCKSLDKEEVWKIIEEETGVDEIAFTHVLFKIFEILRDRCVKDDEAYKIVVRDLFKFFAAPPTEKASGKVGFSQSDSLLHFMSDMITAKELSDRKVKKKKRLEKPPEKKKPAKKDGWDFNIEESFNELASFIDGLQEEVDSLPEKREPERTVKAEKKPVKIVEEPHETAKPEPEPQRPAPEPDIPITPPDAVDVPSDLSFDFLDDEEDEDKPDNSSDPSQPPGVTVLGPDGKPLTVNSPQPPVRTVPLDEL